MATNGGSRCLSALISVANLFILILAIIIMCLSIGNWNDYVSSVLTIIITLCWICCVCVQNNVALSCYTVFMIIDMLILLANAIFYTIRSKQYNNFCYNNIRDGTSPEYGCHDWRNGYKARTIGILICFYIAFALRLFNIIGSCLLAKNIYQKNSVTSY